MNSTNGTSPRNQSCLFYQRRKQINQQVHVHIKSVSFIYVSYNLTSTLNLLTIIKLRTPFLRPRGVRVQKLLLYLRYSRCKLRVFSPFLSRNGSVSYTRVCKNRSDTSVKVVWTTKIKTKENCR